MVAAPLWWRTDARGRDADDLAAAPHDADGDVDTTGVRALLAGLPDPGPMPDEVVARILRRLADEGAVAGPPVARGVALEDDVAGQARAVDVAGGGGGGHGVDALGLGEVATLDERRSQGRAGGRRRWLALGSAAAGVAAGRPRGHGVAPRGPLEQSSTASVQSRTELGAGDTGRPESGATAAAARVRIVSTGTAYQAATLARTAQALVVDLDSSAADSGEAVGPAQPTESTESASRAPAGDLTIASPGGLAACLATLGEADADEVAADVATLNGAAAVVIVTIKGGLKQVYAVDPGCSRGDPMILAGPLPMT